MLLARMMTRMSDRLVESPRVRASCHDFHFVKLVFDQRLSCRSHMRAKSAHLFDVDAAPPPSDSGTGGGVNKG